MILDYATIALIAITAFSVIAGTAGVNFKISKDKVTKLLNDVVNAVQDNKITEEECQRIAADAKAFLEK